MTFEAFSNRYNFQVKIYHNFYVSKAYLNPEFCFGNIGDADIYWYADDDDANNVDMTHNQLHRGKPQRSERRLL